MDASPTGSLPTDAEVERAIASVTGVAEAVVTRASDTGRGRLRIRLHPAEDAERVAWAVAATLRERFGIALDPAAIHAGVTVDDPAPAGEAETDAPAAAPDAASGAAPGAADAAAAAMTDAAVEADPDPAPNAAAAPATASAAPSGTHDSLGLDVDVSATRQAATPAPAAGGPQRDQRTERTEEAASSAPGWDVETGDEPRRVPEPVGMQPGPAAAATTPETPGETPGETTREAPGETTRETIDLTGGFGADADVGAEPPGRVASGSGAGASSAGAGDQVHPGGEELRRERSRSPVTTAEPRPRIRDLDVRRGVSEAEVTAILHLNGVEAIGRVRAVPTTRGVLRGVAEATVAALRDLSNTTLVLGVDSVSQVAPAQDTATVNVLLTYLSERDEETLVGCSLVRGDLERAVMRATLDAVNRRLTPALAPAPLR